MTNLSQQVVAMDGIGLIGTFSFFGPALVVGIVLAVIVVRDRRRPEDEDDRAGLDTAGPLDLPAQR